MPTIQHEADFVEFVLSVGSGIACLIAALASKTSIVHRSRGMAALILVQHRKWACLT